MEYMKLGIKVGLQKTSIQDLETTNPDMCEVWFDVNRSGEYSDLFAALKTMNTDVGLHFWGVLPDSTWANIALPDHDLNTASYAMMERTIEIAASHGYSYVNIHPGSRARIALNLTTNIFTVMTPPVGENDATDNFLQYATKLSERAKHLGVTLTIETVPARVKNDFWTNPSNPDVVNVHELGLPAIFKAADAGIAIANDFGHTAASFIDTDRNRIWQNTLQTTTTLAPITRLLHLGFVLPPYDGSDFHGDLDHPSLDTYDAIPNASEFITLIKLFVDRPDVWALVEPQTDHVKNYALAKKYIEMAKNTNK
jgi:sugar phosphate isomerase/epimerase